MRISPLKLKHSPFKTAQTLKTQRMATQASSRVDYSPSPATIASRVNQTEPRASYAELRVSRSRYKGRSYSKVRHQEGSQREEKESRVVREPTRTKVVMFRNLQEFEVNLQTQKGKVARKSLNLRSYAVATYKGVRKLVNSHQISLHFGDLVTFNLFEGFDGLFTANTLKKHYVNKLMQKMQGMKNVTGHTNYQYTEESIRKTINAIQADVVKQQAENGDNSGSSMVSLVLTQGLLYTANVGPSKVICRIASGRTINLASPHTTDNQTQVSRIVQQGGTLYKTMVNVPFTYKMTIEGPLRVYPSGLTVTRTLGKHSSPRKQPKSPYAQVSHSPKGILSAPQIQYLPCSELKWAIVLSSKVSEKIQDNRVSDIAEQQLSKISGSEWDCEAIEHVCKRILLEAVQEGAQESTTVMMLLFSSQSQQTPTVKEKKVKSKVQNLILSQRYKEKEPSLHREAASLKYIGSRENFATTVQV